ncbi:hypothetical protein [Neisseria sp. Ec49-e6-T10]|uniref:hypothetical protein n=1 Tax=Neisseria sp. Ec49-e6-T10 TaxID=3140744 RepID=UPI003EBE310C
MYKFKMKVCQWEEVDLNIYQQAYKRFGGNISSHPDILAFQHEYADCREKYLAKSDKNNQIVAAMCVWDKKYIANTPESRVLVKDLAIPVQTDELLLPIASNVIIPFKTKVLSEVHQKQVCNASFRINSGREICLAKGLGKNGFSKKSQNTRNRELQRFLDAGGEIYSHNKFTPEQIFEMYSSLFYQRRGKYPENKEMNLLFLNRFKDYIFGSFLFFKGEPCAYQLIIKSDSLDWVNFDYINIGYDQSLAHLSVGTVVMWKNLLDAEQYCKNKNKNMRFSFGNPSAQYKERWCYKQPVGRILSI